MESKICNKCLVDKPKKDNYTRHVSSSDGLRHTCRACRTIGVRNYRETGSTVVGDMSSWSDKRLLELKKKVNVVLENRARSGVSI